MTILKSKITATLLMLMLPLFLVGCTASDLPVIGKYFSAKTKAKEGTLTIWGMWESPEVIKKLTDLYTAENPGVTITYDDRSILDLTDYKERVFTRADQKDANVDIAFVHNSWVSRLNSKLTPAPKGVVLPSDFDTTYFPVAKDSLVSGDNVYGLPLYYDGLALVYNKKHFEEVGQVEPPVAWEEFRRLALTLTVRGPNEELLRAGAAIGMADNIDFFSDILGLMFTQAGTALPDGLADKPAQDALSYYLNFAKEDHVWDANMPEASTAFVQEKVSMIFVPSWVLSDILIQRPDMEIGVAMVPQARADSPTNWGSFWVGVVPSSSKNGDLAWDFLKFMTQETTQKTWFSEASRVRAFGAPYSLVSLATSINPYIAPYLESAKTAKSFEISAKSGNKRQVDALKAVVNSLLLEEMKTAEALEVAKVELAR